jgi:hypothetical protein
LKLQDTRAEYYYFTGKVSDIVRQLGLAGVAIIWVFKTDSAGRQTIPEGLLPAGILILLGLATDLLQYAAGTIIWDRFNTTKEDELENKLAEKKARGEDYDPEAEDFTAPSSINDLTKTLFWVKFILMLLAYIYLIFYLMTRLL